MQQSATPSASSAKESPARIGETAIPVTSMHEDDDGVTLQMSPGTLKLQVFSPDVIRVVYALGASRTESKSFAVIGKPERARFSLSETTDNVRLSTDAIEARVNRASGAVAFYDKGGKPLLVEKADGGKSLVRSHVGNFDTLRSEQAFVLPEGESIYGLGQHQQGQMSYRGANVQLLQENREVAVPFLVSSLGYGVLWDNPAPTKVSVGAGVQEVVPSARLCTEDGQRGGLTARYYDGEDFRTLLATRTDAVVDFDWSKTPPPAVPHDHYSVRWTGFVEAMQGGDYTFFASADDGVRLFIDDKPVVDDWHSRPTQTFAATVRFETASRHRIRMEFYQDRWGAVVRLAWRLPSDAPSPLVWSSEASDAIDYYFIHGPELDSVIGAYRKLTGPVPMFGKWAWGYWQSKERYESQRELLDVVDKHRSHHIPIDGIIQDWRYWDPSPWGSHELDRTRYPDPDKMTRDLHASHVHLLISVWPRFDVGSTNADELQKAGYLYPQAITHEGRTRSHWYDPFNPGARQMYWQQISKELFAHGIDGWWLDASEPELSGEPGEFRSYPTGSGPGARVLNAYPLLHTAGVYEGQRAETSDKRVFILTRSAYAGQQRNAAVTWSGDIQGTWDTYAKQIPAGINFSLSGIPYWSSDTGGFFSGNPADPAYAELFTRWFQFSAFCPMFRVHGTAYAKEMWRFDAATQKILLAYDQLRYHLLPYIYSVSWKVTSEGYSMMRGLVMDFPDDVKTHDVPDQFLFGPSLMVAPITKPLPARRTIYLPAGPAWTDFWTGKLYLGGQAVEAVTPIETLPLFVRAGAIIPYGPAVEYAMDKADPIELRIYRGSDGAFVLYEDEGDNYNYEKGAYATIPFTWTEATRTLRIGKRKGHFAGMLTERTFKIVWVASGHGAGIPSTAKADAVVRYKGEIMDVRAPATP